MITTDQNTSGEISVYSVYLKLVRLFTILSMTCQMYNEV